MSYEPHTVRIEADEQCELPRSAVGVTVDRDGDTYVVHYLTLAEEAQETQRGRIREAMPRVTGPERDRAAEKRRELSLDYSETETSEPNQ